MIRYLAFCSELRENLHVPVVRAASGEHHKLNQPHLISRPHPHHMKYSTNSS